MATNVTQKDETLDEVIEWLDFREKGVRIGGMFSIDHSALMVAYRRGQEDAFAEAKAHCESMLGYSGGQMPDEVPNQSEDAK